MCHPASPPVPPSRSPSRRYRLWELPPHCHCPVLGLCLTRQQLRQLIDKAMPGHRLDDDYALHVLAVSECAKRTPLSERLQERLDALCESGIRALQGCKTWEALACHAPGSGPHDLGGPAAETPDAPGPDLPARFWAAITHPLAQASWQEDWCRHVHLMQHEAGALAHRHARDRQALLRENQVLTRELAKVTSDMVDAVSTGGQVDVNDTKTYNNGVKVVPSYLLKPVVVDKDNWQKALVDSGRVRHVGFSTHATPDVISAAIRSDEFDYVNLHWYFVNDLNRVCVAEAAQRDMGVFIISPNDKGGKLYAPPEKLVKLCAPLASPVAGVKLNTPGEVSVAVPSAVEPSYTVTVLPAGAEGSGGGAVPVAVASMRMVRPCSMRSTAERSMIACFINC